MKIEVLIFYCVIGLLFNPSFGYAQAASKACETVRREFAENISVGDSEEKLVAYIKSRNWDYWYNKYSNLYVTGYTVEEKKGITLHTIFVSVQLDEKRRVSSVTIRDSYKPGP